MKIISKNEGRVIPYEENNGKITFNDELMVNLQKYERDFEQHLDICMDANKCLAMGLTNNYVAQIDIPARQYEDVVDGVDEDGRDKITKSPLPLDMNNVVLTLWNVEV